MLRLLKLCTQQKVLLKSLLQNTLISQKKVLMSTASETLSCKIGVVQFTATANKEENFSVCKKLILEGKEKGAQVIFLPECFDYVSETSAQSLELAEPIDGLLITRYKQLAKEENLFLSLGGFHHKDEKHSTDRFFNSHLMISSSGDLIGSYSKLHLFDLNIPGKVTLKESYIAIPGTGVSAPVSTPVGNIGMAICYDLRFPELSNALAAQGAQVLLYPSAFSVPTGRDHWHLLLRTRALETGCFVVAAAQSIPPPNNIYAIDFSSLETGQHNPKRASYGHALVVDPTGRVLLDCYEASPTVGIVDLNFSSPEVEEARRKKGIIERARRSDLFITNAENLERCIDIGDKNVQFGDEVLEPSRIFFRSQGAFAFLDYRPILPGHILVCPTRPVEHFNDLSPVEVAQLYAAVRRIGPHLLTQYQATAMNYSQQNGGPAGQGIPYVHIHMLPRKPNDLERNDDVYSLLESHDTSPQSTPLSIEEMDGQVDRLRSLFYTKN